jgi:hypothetical protein
VVGFNKMFDRLIVLKRKRRMIMDHDQLETLEPAELAEIEGGVAGIALGLGAGFMMGLWIGGYAHDVLNGQTSMSNGESAAILGALKQGGII